MKKFFRLVSVLALAGLTLTYTSCTDYSEDIDKVNNRVDDVQSQLKSLEDAYKEADAKLQTEIDNAKKDLDKKISDLNTAHGKDVKELRDSISALRTAVKRLQEVAAANQANIKTIQGQIKELEDKKIPALVDSIDAHNKRMGHIQGTLSTLDKLYDIKGKKISEIMADITKAQDRADDAYNAIFDEKDGKLKKILGVYYEEGKLEGKINTIDETIENLEETHKTDVAKLKKTIDSLNTVKIDETKFHTLLKQALANGEGVTDEVAYLGAEIDTRIKAASEALNTRIDDLYNIFYQQLRSLVFVPEFYADGIEAVEYAYAEFMPLTAGTAADATLDGFTLKNYEEYGISETAKLEYIYPAATVRYEMNPSSATVTKDTPLAFITSDALSISTRAAVASSFKPEFISTENGRLAVSLSAETLRHFVSKDSVTVFALQATVKAKGAEEGDKAVTVTSDYARIFASKFDLTNIAFKDAYKQYDVEAEDAKCEHVTGDRYHIYETPVEALNDDAHIELGYKETFDFNNKFESHYVTVGTETKTAKGVYDQSEFAESKPVTYQFDLINYTVGDVDGGGESVVTLTDGVLSANGNKTAIDRQPLVRVRAVIDGKTVLVGFVKVKITSNEYFAVDPAFVLTTELTCNDATVEVVADSMKRVYKTLDFTGDNAEAAFDALYRLQVDKDGAAVRYVLKDTKVENGFANEVNALGSVKESAANASKLVITLTSQEVGKIFQTEGSSYTTYVRYIRAKEGAPVDEYEGVYVPVTVTVTRDEAGTVGTKLANYWFDNDKAYLNVAVPGAYPGQPLDDEWKTPINQVWDNNLPVFTVNGAAVTGKYYYYFAPEQTELKDSEGKVVYTLSVKNKTIKDWATGKMHDVASNAEVSDLEGKIMADMGSAYSIYANNELFANDVAIAVIVNYDAEGNDVHTIEFYNTPLALEVLNFTASNPKEESKLFANIGVALREKDCPVAVPLADQINKYYFLRPLNFEGSDTNVVVDGVDAYKPESNINIIDAVKFSDWRGEKFFDRETEDYSNLWYFAYYGVNKVTVDLPKVTTTLGNQGERLLSDVTKKIELSFGKTEATLEKGKVVEVKVDYVTAPDPALWNASFYPFIVEKLGFIRYHNNGANVSGDFTLTVPVKISYTWGDIEKNVIITVKKTN